jgi:23S rRNA pseudouridine1911/1915/1917 synthase
MAIFLLLLANVLFTVFRLVDGFMVIVPPSPAIRQRLSGPHTVTVVAAKPLPSEYFDLEAIEAYEAQLFANEEIGFEEDLDGEDDIGSEKEAEIFHVPIELDGARLDAVVTGLLGEGMTYSRSFCGNLVTSRNVFVDNAVVTRKSFKVSASQEIRVHIPSVQPMLEGIVPQNISLDVLYEDEHMIVINKAANIVVHPAPGNWDNTIVNALAYHSLSSQFGPIQFDESSSSSILRPGVVHRLDKGTTGVLIVAKNPASLTKLSEQFALRRVQKIYLAVTLGDPGRDVLIDKPIGRHPIHRQRMRVVPENSPQVGRRAISRVHTIVSDQRRRSLVRIAIATGRTHQIRVHLQDRKTPVYGDSIYGAKANDVDRPLLHAYRLRIQHPVTGEMMLFQAPLPEDICKVAMTIAPNIRNEFPELFERST